MILIELFSGVGSQYRALQNIGINIEKTYISEIDERCNDVYKLLHNNNPFQLGDIKNIDKLPICDLLTYSFPCQDLSTMGKNKGLINSDRSSLLWELDRLLQSSPLPQDMLMENVSGILNKNNINDFNIWVKALEQYGYTNYIFTLNAKDFGVPQNRKRVFMISRLNNKTFEIPKPTNIDVKLKDIIENDVDERYYLDKYLPYLEKTDGNFYGKIKNIKWQFDKPVYSLDGISQTILKTYVKERYKIYIGGRIRLLTELEIMKLMGFTKNDYEKIKHLRRSTILNMMGNSIVIPVLENIFEKITNKLG